MKSRIKKFSFLLIVIATAILVIGLSIPINSNKAAIAFEYFPFNKPYTVNFQVNAASFGNLTSRQKKDQFLDWLLFTIESDPSFSTQDITKASYDISPVRYDYLKPVSNFEYGETRSLYVGNETIVALIPQDSSPEQRIDYLAHVADKQRQNLGQIPAKLEVFEYQLDLEKETAQLTRVEELNTISLFQDKKYGYYEITLETIDDINQFLDQVDRISFAQVKGSKLFVGGRKIKIRSHSNNSVIFDHRQAKSMTGTDERRLLVSGYSGTSLAIFGSIPRIPRIPTKIPRVPKTRVPKTRVPKKLPPSYKLPSKNKNKSIVFESIKIDNNFLYFITSDGNDYEIKINPSLDKEKSVNLVNKLDIPKADVINHRTNNRLTISFLIESIRIGNINVFKTGNAFTVGWQSLDIDEGHSLARELSYYYRSDDFENKLIDHPKINSVAKQKDGSVYYVKTDNSEKWLKLTSGGDGGKIPPDYTFRMASAEPPEIPDPWFSAPSDDSEYLLLGWVDDLDNIEATVIFSRSKTENPSISDDIRNGNYIAAAPKIIKQKKLNKAITEINSLMKSQDYKRAAKLVDDSIDELGQEPDLMIRKAVVNIKLKRLKVEAVSIEGLETPNSADVFDELNGIVVNKDKGKFKAIEKDDAFIYVQDSPELNNIDWSNPIENSIPFISGKTKVYKLQDGEVGNINLDDFFGGNRGSLPPSGDGKGGDGNGNQPPNSSGSGKYNNSQYYGGSFIRANQLARLGNKCETGQENKTKTLQCIQEKNEVYIVYVRN